MAMTSLMSCWPRAGWVPDSALGRFWGSSCPRIFFIAFALAVPVAALSVLLGWVIASAIPPQGESKLPDPAYMLIAVSLSPIVENWVVLRLGDVIPDQAFADCRACRPVSCPGQLESRFVNGNPDLLRHRVPSHQCQEPPLWILGVGDPACPGQCTLARPVVDCRLRGGRWRRIYLIRRTFAAVL